jgi:hypothetical protein
LRKESIIREEKMWTRQNPKCIPAEKILETKITHFLASRNE